MTVLQAIILGIVQGLTEFLPISSSGHLVIVPALLGWELPPPALDVLLHTGSLVAIVLVLWKDLLSIAKQTLIGGQGRTTFLMLFVASIPAGIVGLSLEGQIRSAFQSPRLVACFLMTTGAVLLLAEGKKRSQTGRSGDLGSLSVGSSLGIGMAQSVAILPGISRSGTTISAGMALGLSRDAAARFSFLLVVPILLVTSLVEVPKLAQSGFSTGVLVGGFGSSMMVSYVAMAGLLRYLKRNSLTPFGWYCIAAGSLALVALTFIQ